MEQVITRLPVINQGTGRPRQTHQGCAALSAIGKHTRGFTNIERGFITMQTAFALFHMVEIISQKQAEIVNQLNNVFFRGSKRKRGIKIIG